MSFGIEGNRKRPFLRQSQQLACSFWCILSVSVVLPSSMNTKSLSPFWGPRLLAAWRHAAALPDLNKQGPEAVQPKGQGCWLVGFDI